jgi:cytidine deaminase
MNNKLEQLKKLAKPLVSGYKVSCIVQTETIDYDGINVEITPQYNIHAEQSAIHNAIVNGATQIKSIYLQDSPCGHCRQFINEIDENIEIFFKGETVKIKDLIPNSFGQEELLGKKVSPFVEFSNPIEHFVNPMDYIDDIKESIAAFEYMCSFSPYTKSNCGLIISTDNSLFRGRYIEAAAFNMSVLPIMGAFSQFFLSGNDIYSIRDVILVENKNRPVNHGKITKEILSYLQIEDKLKVIQM